MTEQEIHSTIQWRGGQPLAIIYSDFILRLRPIDNLSVYP